MSNEYTTSTPKIALVTGGSRGIGRNTVVSLAKRGVHTIFTYHSHSADADAVVAAVRDEGAQGIALQLDAGTVASFDTFVESVKSALAKLDKYHLLILDDIVYVSKDQAETSVLFELIGTRYERRSMLITANQPFGEWGKVFPDQAMTLAAVDRLDHHATIFEMNVES